MFVLQDQIRLSKGKHNEKGYQAVDIVGQTVHDCNFMRAIVDALSNIQEIFSIGRIGTMDLEPRNSRIRWGS
jgi:hypothetical protein